MAAWRDEQLEQARELMNVIAVAPTGDDRFRGATPDWFGEGRIFGGVVIAQALSAAVQSVPDDISPHSVHGYFLRTVRRLRSWRRYPPVFPSRLVGEAAVPHVRRATVARAVKGIPRGSYGGADEPRRRRYPGRATEQPARAP